MKRWALSNRTSLTGQKEINCREAFAWGPAGNLRDRFTAIPDICTRRPVWPLLRLLGLAKGYPVPDLVEQAGFHPLGRRNDHGNRGIFRGRRGGARFGS
jgi:hypothetical protein